MGAMINEPARQPSVMTSVPLPQYAQDLLEEFKQSAEASSSPEWAERQVGGNHYRELAIQPLTYIRANRLEFVEGNIVKLVSRFREKGGLEDLDKLIHYAQILREEYARELER